MSNRIYFSSYEVVIRTALAGRGITLGVDALVEDLFEQKQLVCTFAEGVRSREAHYVVSPRNEAVTRPMRLFSEWLFNEVATSRRVHMAEL
jgi:DNA-binding transcriptional LysR family regulator